MNKLFEFDSSFQEEEIIGVDEVGRGPLAGPVVSAAVILKANTKFKFLNDSKQLTEKQRDYAELEIKEKALAYTIHELSALVIDQSNILRAAQETMINCINELNRPKALVLVDGNLKIDISHKQVTVVKGDSKSAAIAAASILAKVHRDRLMREYANTYPEYAFESNKGYGSQKHRDAIKKFGPCEIHRLSFLSKILPNEQQMSLFK